MSPTSIQKTQSKITINKLKYLIIKRPTKLTQQNILKSRRSTELRTITHAYTKKKVVKLP